MKWLCIAAGGAIGALLRYGVSGLTLAVLGSRFPWGTLCVNVLGSLAIGLLWAVFDAVSVSENMQLLLLVGLLGAFTTFSTFSLETLHLMRDRQFLFAAANVGANCVLGLMVAALGMIIGRAIVTLLR